MANLPGRRTLNPPPDSQEGHRARVRFQRGHVGHESPGRQTPGQRHGGGRHREGEEGQLGRHRGPPQARSVSSPLRSPLSSKSV